MIQSVLEIFKFPLSLIMAAVLVLSILLCRNSKIAGIITDKRLAVASIAIITLAIAVEGTWSYALHQHWVFHVAIIVFLTILGLASLSDWKKKSYAALLSHLGLFLVLAGSFFSAPDYQDLQLRVYQNGPKEHMAFDDQGRITLLPFSISLDEFKTDYYEDGVSPRQYTSILTIEGEKFQTSVNSPCRYDGYDIYQYSYGHDAGTYSVLKIVHDPWLPVTTIGTLLLIISALMGLKMTWNSWKILIAAFILAIVFTAISVARINFSTLMPALRSLWFVPHLAVYMLAYSIMALSFITGISSVFLKRIPDNLPKRLLSTSSSLLLIGMICGAIWAKQAWGDYWTWDSKECWAAVTWLLALGGMHVKNKRITLAFIILAFLAIQITWYGVNYLPSADRSLHTYNKETQI